MSVKVSPPLERLRVPVFTQSYTLKILNVSENWQLYCLLTFSGDFCVTDPHLLTLSGKIKKCAKVLKWSQRPRVPVCFKSGTWVKSVFYFCLPTQKWYPAQSTRGMVLKFNLWHHLFLSLQGCALSVWKGCCTVVNVCWHVFVHFIQVRFADENFLLLADTWFSSTIHFSLSVSEVSYNLLISNLFFLSQLLHFSSLICEIFFDWHISALTLVWQA
jgi:hypothetical protein